MNRIRLTSALIVAFAGTALVAGDAAAQQPAAPAPDITGEYTLAQIDDADLPIVISEADGCRREITSATLTLAAENHWTLRAQLRETCGEEVTEKAVRQQGTYSSEERTLQFTAAADEEAEAAADDIPVVEIDPVTVGAVSDAGIQVTLGSGETARTLSFRK
jgi:hypothetical protein